MSARQNLWIKKIRRKFKDPTHWAKLRIKSDKGEDYIDILIGRKGKQWHAHYGINFDSSWKFGCYRGITHSIERRMFSKRKGHLEDKKLIINPVVKRSKTLILQLNINGNTKEVIIVKFGLQPRV